MRISSIFLLLIMTWFNPLALTAQSPPAREKTYRFSGYVKYLQTTIFADGTDNIITDNLLHHRLNFRWFPVEPLSFTVEVRNRIHFGELVKTTNTFGNVFGELIDNNDLYDMSVLVADKRSLAWHLMLDRAFVRYSKKKFEGTLGRQRINWGVAMIWNPNDVFNAYSFFDFDYEERPGSDAARLVFYPNARSSFEIASKIPTRKEDVVSAALYKWNKRKYDFQALAGVANNDLVAGGGWAGNIRKAGFKGEASYFHPYRNMKDTAGVFTGTVAVDYIFKNSFYINGTFLYSGSGTDAGNFFQLSARNISAKNLSPYKYNFLVQGAYPIKPILNAALAVLYSPGQHALFLNPVLTYSIRENWDIDVIAQLFFSQENGSFSRQTEILYFRLKWSY